MVKPFMLRSRREVAELRAELEAAQQENAQLRTEVKRVAADAQEPTRQRGRGWRLAAEAAFVALIGVGGSLGGAYLGADAASQGVTLQLQAERDREAREKVGQVYADYLSALATYSAEVGEEFSPKNGVPTPDDLQRLFPLYRAFRDKADLVAVYGSDDAQRAHQLIKAGLPEIVALGTRRRLEVVWPQGSAANEYSRGYADFQAAFCREASARPRSGCA
ncbi:hypothetical protein [Kribbella sp. VKM Ac-2566]|uniref:hypothetical protein n=1 Tax=Kribbella sp. VKM Ac-2566 TaxID=2512218 RepID=UPI0010645648|nr:hypothetical protein [Kribbella sp. VKM Ac-2566]TDW98550.1 hypothetical protein EV647_3269 [Kribbella sp. VKM Ac-2566]